MDSYHFLLKIKRKKEFIYETASDKEKEALNYLYESGFLTFNISTKQGKSISIYKISSAGENYLYEKKHNNFHSKITTTIAVIGLIKSFLPEIQQLYNWLLKFIN